MHDVIAAPYASTPIPMHLTSTTGMKYRQFNCMECGREFLERQGDVVYRIGDSLAPSEVHLGRDERINAMCSGCMQRYTVTVSYHVVYERDGIPLYMQPQSVYLVSEPIKKLRFLHCLECGKAFQTISDRIGQVVDNRIPFEYVEPSRLGPIEAMCSSNKCGQSWALMV